MNQLENNKVNVDSLRKSYKEFVKNNTLILKSQFRRFRRFRSEKHNVFTEVYNIELSAINNKRMQSIDSVGTYA